MFILPGLSVGGSVMARKKELDNLSKDMIQCRKDGYGFHYGAWKAAQQRPVVVKKNDSIPDGWLVCKYCGVAFKPKTKRKQFYCDVTCQRRAQFEKDREKNNRRQREYRARVKAGLV